MPHINQNISINNRPAYAGLFYNITLREKNTLKLTKVNSFSYNTLTTNYLLLNNNIFQSTVFSPFSGYLRQYLTTLSDSGLNETIEKKINTELILAGDRSNIQPGSSVAMPHYRSVNRGASGILIAIVNQGKNRDIQSGSTVAMPHNQTANKTGKNSDTQFGSTVALGFIARHRNIAGINISASFSLVRFFWRGKRNEQKPGINSNSRINIPLMHGTISDIHVSRDCPSERIVIRAGFVPRSESTKITQISYYRTGINQHQIMQQKEQFTQEIIGGYTFKGGSFLLGSAMLNGEVVKEAAVRVPLRTLNRHGLISGATGTGKTKTLQVLAEALSNASIPVLLMDIKGDLSGLAAAGAGHPKIDERTQLLGIQFAPASFPVELLSLSDEPGVRLRATVTEFGPVLLAKVFDLNSTQESILSMLFKYCDDNQMPLLDLKDLQKTLQWAANDGKEKLKDEYGAISPSSVGTIMRKVIELQQQGADNIFGEPSFEVEDLMRIADDGRGIINILRVTDIQDKPKLFSTFMLQLLAELYATLPEEGDPDQPKLVMFIDEAHLVFSNANNILLSQLETIIKLIRSKGVGIFFVTQNPVDIAPAVLSQLGLKIQHSLRAFTANDRKAIKQTAENYPLSAYYKTEDIITQLGTGEALVTLLNEKGIPTPLAATMLCPPQSRMDILSADEINSLVGKSELTDKYNRTVDTKSAHEILTEKMHAAKEIEPEVKTRRQEEEKTVIEQIGGNTVVRSMLRTAGNMIVRSLLGSLGVSGATKRRKRNLF